MGPATDEARANTFVGTEPWLPDPAKPQVQIPTHVDHGTVILKENPFGY